MEDGRLAECGTHDQLLAADARYAALYSLQATAYAN
jgi:ABC-type multidrug transport system fused ATPase/permease subunit